MAMLSSSLFYELVPPKSETRMGYPATDLIYNLLYNAGADVASFRRNCQVSYRLIESIRILYDEINTRIQKAEESGSWEHYDAYSSAIDPLERLLLEIMEVTEVERTEYFLTDDSHLESFQQFMENWADRRRKIRKYLHDIRGHKELKILAISPMEDEEIRTAEEHDDRSLLQSLLNSINQNISDVIRNQTKTIVKNVRESLQSALELQKGSPRKLLNNDLSTLAIKCAMIVDGVIRLMKGVGAGRDSVLYDRLNSNEIWSMAKKLATDIHRYFQNDDPRPNLGDLTQTYTKLEAALVGKALIDRPESCTKLFPLVGKIGRAYHAQSLVLASLCYKAISTFDSNQNYAARDALERALVKTIDAFKAAGKLNKEYLTNGPSPTASGVTTNGAESNTAANYNNSCEGLYNASIIEINACYTVMGIGGGIDLQAMLEEGRKKDKERLELYRMRTTNIVQNQELVNLTLKVHENSKEGALIKEMSARVRPTVRLTYIRWLVAKELVNEQHGADSARFESSDFQSVELSPEADLKSLVKGSNEHTLYLIAHKEK